MDKLGNILRKFYKKYGVDNEGPPDGINLSHLAPDLDMDKDLDLIMSITNNQSTWENFNYCKPQIEVVAKLLEDSTNFLNEIDNTTQIYPDDSEFMKLVNGNFWYYLGSGVEQLPENMIKVFPFNILQKQLLLVQGSLVFRLYISLVYMKESPVLNILEEASRRNMPISEECNKLLRCDYLRHLRNSLAHASFMPTIAGIYFEDRNGFKTISTPGFLNLLLSWILVINTCCLTVISKHINDNK